MISDRTKRIVRTGNVCKSIVLVEFESFLDESFGRLSSHPDITVSSGSVDYTYKDYFTSAAFPKIGKRINLWGGGLGFTGNITLQLNNSDDIVKDMQTLTTALENTYVSVYVLLDDGGELKLENADRRFRGTIDPGGIIWNASTLSIKITDGEWKKDAPLLDPPLTKLDYPHLDDSQVGTYKHLIGGKGTDSLINDLYPQGFGTIRADGYPKCTTPTILVNTKTNQYLIAGHPIARALTFTTKAAQSFMKFDTTADQLGELMEVTTDIDGDNPTITLPVNTSHYFIDIVPTIIGEDNQEGDDSLNAIDNNEIIEKGYDQETYCQMDMRRWAMYFLKGFDFEGTYGAYLRFRAAERATPTSGRGMFMLITDGNTFFHDGASPVGNWHDEVGSKTYYKIITGGQEWDEFWWLRQPARYYHKESGNLFKLNEYPTINPIGEFNPSRARVWRLGKTWQGGEWVNHDPDIDSNWIRCIFPPVEVKNLDLARPQDWADDPTMDLKRFKAYQLGLRGRFSLRASTFYVRFTGIPYHGGSLPSVPSNIPYFDYPKEWSENPLTRDLKDKMIQKVDSWNEENMANWRTRAAEITDISNVGDIQCMIDGFTNDNTAGGTASESPVEMLKYIMKYRMNLVEGTDWDADSFNAVANERQSAAGGTWQDYWRNHIDIGDQIAGTKWMRKFCAENGLILSFHDDKFFLKTADWHRDDYVTKNPATMQADENDIGTYKFGKHREIFDSYTIPYAISSCKRKFLGKLIITPFDTNFYDASDLINDTNYDISGYTAASLQTLCHTTWANYFHSSSEKDLHTMTVPLESVRDINTARRIGIGLVMKHSRSIPRPIVEFNGGKKFMEAQIGDVIYLSHRDWAAKDKTYYQISYIVENPITQKYNVTALQIKEGT